MTDAEQRLHDEALGRPMTFEEAIRRDRVMMEGEEATGIMDNCVSWYAIVKYTREEDEQKMEAYREAKECYQSSLPWKARFYLGMIEATKDRHFQHSMKYRDKFFIYMNSRNSR